MSVRTTSPTLIVARIATDMGVSIAGTTRNTLACQCCQTLIAVRCTATLSGPMLRRSKAQGLASLLCVCYVAVYHFLGFSTVLQCHGALILTQQTANLEANCSHGHNRSVHCTHLHTSRHLTPLRAGGSSSTSGARKQLSSLPAYGCACKQRLRAAHTAQQ